MKTCRVSYIFGTITSGLRVQKDKIDELRALYASIKMKIAANIPEVWEDIIFNEMKFNKITNMLEPGESMTVGFNIRGTKYKTKEHEKWLAMLAQYLEDGFIKYLFYSYGDTTTYVVKDGRLYRSRLYDEHMNAQIERRIVYYHNQDGDLVEGFDSGRDSNIGKWFNCNEET